MTRPGLLGFRTSPTASQGLDWATLDDVWAAAGGHDVFSAGWMSDHLSDASRERGGGAFESLTTAAALAHRVPGKWIGIAVIANTFRHPAVVAKSATVLDNATGGRFVLGLGAGWHERLRLARETARTLLDAGAGHLTLGIAAREGPRALEIMAREVAVPVAEQAGRT